LVLLKFKEFYIIIGRAVASLPLKFQVVSVTFVKGGDVYNVIPESVTFGGTLRSLTNEGLSYLIKRTREVNSSSKRTVYIVTTICYHYHFLQVTNTSMGEDCTRAVSGTSMYSLVRLHGGKDETLSGCTQ
jgi:metal-dependent amidase/aminoacylase/carboxypeptidase family protein